MAGMLLIPVNIVKQALPGDAFECFAKQTRRLIPLRGAILGITPLLLAPYTRILAT
jgi:hypothetical protein